VWGTGKGVTLAFRVTLMCDVNISRHEMGSHDVASLPRIWLL